MSVFGCIRLINYCEWLCLGLVFFTLIIALCNNPRSHVRIDLLFRSDSRNGVATRNHDDFILRSDGILESRLIERLFSFFSHCLRALWSLLHHFIWNWRKWWTALSLLWLIDKEDLDEGFYRSSVENWSILCYGRVTVRTNSSLMAYL